MAAAQRSIIEQQPARSFFEAAREHQTGLLARVPHASEILTDQFAEHAPHWQFVVWSRQLALQVAANMPRVLDVETEQEEVLHRLQMGEQEGQEGRGEDWRLWAIVWAQVALGAAALMISLRLQVRVRPFEFAVQNQARRRRPQSRPRAPLPCPCLDHLVPVNESSRWSSTSNLTSAVPQLCTASHRPSCRAWQVDQVLHVAAMAAC